MGLARTSDGFDGERYVLRARQIAGQHCVDLCQPAVGGECVEHAAQLLRRDAVARNVGVARVVREEHGRQCDHLVAKHLQRRHDRREADMTAGDL